MQGTSSIGFTEELNLAMVERLRDRNIRFYVSNNTNEVTSPFTQVQDFTLQENTEDSLEDNKDFVKFKKLENTQK